VWEYRVLRWPAGQYTESLNAYAAEGCELVHVVRDDAPAPPAAPKPGLPVPGALGKIGAAAETIGKLGGSTASAEPSSLLWVLRRPREE
jgi:hypothetical protein